MGPLCSTTLLAAIFATAAGSASASGNNAVVRLLVDPRMSTLGHDTAETQNADYGGAHPFELMASDDKRNLQFEDGDENEYEPMRFYFNTLDVDNLAARDASTAAHVEFFKSEALPEIERFWSSALRVFPASKIEVATNPCFAIEGSVEITTADLAVYVIVDPETQPVLAGSCSRSSPDDLAPLAGASVCQIDQYNRPTVGIMTICLESIDLDDPDSRFRAIQSVKHEFAHMLGFSSSSFPYFYDPLTGRPRTKNPVRKEVTCSDGSKRDVVMPDESTLREEISPKGVRHFSIVTPTVVNVARNHFDCPRMTGARLESQPTGPEDCLGSHWEEVHYNSEIMSAVATKSRQYLSPLTLALFEDSGWYRADYSVSSISPFGHMAGCDFVYEDCIVDGKVPEYSIGAFCTLEKPLGCSPDHKMVSGCDQATFDNELDEEFQYFPDPRVGGQMPQNDYCPSYLFQTLRDSQTLEEFEIDCTDESLEGESFVASMETFGPNSRCIDGGSNRPYCLPINCNADTQIVEIKFGNINIECIYDNQEVEIPWISGLVLTCPRLAQICPDMFCPHNCAGRGICNTSKWKRVCDCFDESDPSPFCANSPIIQNLEPTVSPMPTEAPAPTAAPTERPSVGQTSAGGRKTIGFVSSLAVLVLFVVR